MRTANFLIVSKIVLIAMKEIGDQSFFKRIIMVNASVRKVIMMIIKIAFAKNANNFGISYLHL